MRSQCFSLLMMGVIGEEKGGRMKTTTIEQIIYDSGSLYCPIYGVSQNDSHIYIYLHENEKLDVNTFESFNYMEDILEADYENVDITEDYTITERGKEDNCINKYTKLPKEVIVVIFKKW